MNTGTFSGRLGRDAELRATGSGKDVCSFSLGVNVGWGDKKETLWVDCTLWGERGKKIAQYLTKGTIASVSGDIGVRTYESKKDGKTVAVMTCNVQQLTLLGGGEKQSDKTAEKPAQAAPAESFSDDIPF